MTVNRIISLMHRNRARLNVAIDQGRGPAVVLVHGIASSHVTFVNLIPRLIHHRVIAIDLLGFGASPAPDDSKFTTDEHVAALASTIKSLRLRKRFVLVGHSMGALIAARYAATRSSSLAGLILVSPPIYPATGEFDGPREKRVLQVYRAAFDALRANKTLTMFDASLLGRLSPIKDVLDLNEQNWHAFDLSLANTIESQTMAVDIARVTVPVQVLYGTLDPFVVPSVVHTLERMQHVTVKRVPFGDHLIRGRLAEAIANAIAEMESL